MEDYMHKSDYERDEEIKVLFDRVEDLDEKVKEVINQLWPLDAF